MSVGFQRGQNANQQKRASVIKSVTEGGFQRGQGANQQKRASGILSPKSVTKENAMECDSSGFQKRAERK